MEFPFGRKRKKVELQDDTAAELPKVKPSQKAATPPPKSGENLTGMFKGRKRKAALAELMQRYEAIQRIKDPALQLVEYKGLLVSCAHLSEQMTGKDWLTGSVTGLGGVAMGAAGLMTLNPFLFMGGIFAVGAGAGLLGKNNSASSSLLSPRLAKDSKALLDIYNNAQAAVNRIITQVPLVNFAQSSFCDQATGAFPALKDRFLTAAAKDKMLEDAKKAQQPKPDNDKPFKF